MVRKGSRSKKCKFCGGALVTLKEGGRIACWACPICGCQFHPDHFKERRRICPTCGMVAYKTVSMANRIFFVHRTIASDSGEIENQGCWVTMTPFTKDVTDLMGGKP